MCRASVGAGRLFAFFFAAVCEAAVELAAEGFAAEILPVQAGVDQVKVPDLVDLLGGRHWGGRDAGEVEEALVLLDRLLSEGFLPAVLAAEALEEGEGASGLFEGEDHDVFVELFLFHFHLDSAIDRGLRP